MEQDYHPGDSRTVNQIRGCGSTYLPGRPKWRNGAVAFGSSTPVRLRSGCGTCFELLTQIRNFPVLPLPAGLAVN
jgi:hypothetical protein